MPTLMFFGRLLILMPKPHVKGNFGRQKNGHLSKCPEGGDVAMENLKPSSKQLIAFQPIKYLKCSSGYKQDSYRLHEP